ncbi:cytochrome c biogenesis protein CcsA [Flammeovirga sp. MY04]|uniref:cytochrome c biogenesis protein n=1 Tax=Flammeovirga sp. MY04 TaxID=1191459 RepID=UPI0008061A82|nr:cytochrome c biogenesis protein CcsA [Flammeovirga sp. MY04]ANQ52679.1 cytochrome c biogenesis protein CcsA [Flammeovirga sp. MY04]
MKKIFKFLFSNELTLVALFSYAVAMGVATFVENDYGTPAAREMVYNALWFEILQVILGINFIGNIKKYKLFRKEKAAVFTFHIAFIIILLGAFITRNFGYEGNMHIREGQSSNQLISLDRYFNAHIHSASANKEFNRKSTFTQLHQPNFEWKEEINGDQIKVTPKMFVPDAVQTVIEGGADDAVIEVVTASESGRKSVFLAKGKSMFVNGQEITFNNPNKGAINIREKGVEYTIETPQPIGFFIMADQSTGSVDDGIESKLQKEALYTMGDFRFVIKDIHEGLKLGYSPATTKKMKEQAADLLFVDVTVNDETKEVILASLSGVVTPFKEVVIGGYTIDVSFGPQVTELPFSLFLNHFEMERYPGSTNPSAYSSEVIVQDGDVSYPYTIFMNNVLDHSGYRFFQASFDQDEKGTILSVNQDRPGTIVTYIGYLLMTVAMVLSMFEKKSRFRLVSGKLSKLKAQSVALLLMGAAVLGSHQLKAQTEVAEHPNQEKVEVQEAPQFVDRSQHIDGEHSKLFGSLIVQDMDGRLKPVNTLSSEFLRKLTRKTTYKMVYKDGAEEKMNSDQLFLALQMDPGYWQSMPIIKVDKDAGKGVFDLLDMEQKPMVSFNDLINNEGDYLLRAAVDDAQKKKPSERGEFDKELIKIDERFNILYQGLSGNYLKIFPVPNDPDHNWFNANFMGSPFAKEDSTFVRNITKMYFMEILKARESKDWSQVNQNLEYIRLFQQKMGEDIYPTDNAIKMELLYNKMNIFNNLFPIYWMLGIYLLGVALWKVFKVNTASNRAYTIGVILQMVAFGFFTCNLLLRWYIAQYPPWTNGYEMLILVAWALFLFGFFFYKKSDFILPLVSLFGGTLLFVSFLDWLNPEITNLVPVLKSYWLKIHVAIIVSSYAPLALSALLGFINLIFITIRNEKFKKPILELTYVSELSMTIGLYMLAVGTFLGGVWANESWGRYWGWDPKETWALISVIVYSVVLHLRLVPALKGNYTFNLASLLAFSSIVMTSFGVNYYLTGLHSYATGDPVPVPTFVYYVVAMVFTLAIAAYYRNQKKI